MASSPDEHADDILERLRAQHRDLTARFAVLGSLVESAEGGGIVLDAERARAVERLQRHAHLHATVASLGELALTGVAVPALAQRVCMAVAEELDVELCKVLELTPDERSLVLRAGVGWAPGLVGVATVGTGASSQAGYTLATDEPVIVADLATETRFSGPPLLHDHGVVSGVSAVIRGRQRSYGVLGAHTKRPRAFSEEEVRFFVSVANVLALAIERKRSDEQLVANDRLLALGTLAAGVGHEINNPMATIVANLELAVQALQGWELPGALELVEELEDARQAAERVRLTVRDLGAFSRAGAGAADAVDLGDAIEGAARLAARELHQRARLVRDYGHSGPVLATEARLAQVLVNLLVNAAQAIELGRPDANEVRVRTRDDGPFVVVEVSDTGKGIAPEHLPRVFTPFFTTKPPGRGTGLGLAICQRIVTDLGGQLEVDSVLGEGATFRLQLRKAPAPQSAETRAVPAAETRRGRVLVVDDDPLVLRAVRRSLASEHEVVAVASGDEALEHLTRGARFDVILCDLMMPGVSGMELHAELTRVAPDQAERLVLMTGGAFTEEARVFLERSRGAVLEKPFAVQQVRAAVRARLR
jgi:signal transduction histidine kinase/CheY-like chemotaxis protein